MDFMSAHSTFAGYKNAEDYFKDNNPMKYVPNIGIPCLVLNAFDDLVSLKCNIEEDVFL
jgi:predicted alpha/beta-fold hydrolase